MIKHSKIVRKTTKNIEEKILCTYKNVSNTWQVVKITNIPNFDWEKTVASGQTIVFEASSKAKLKILSANNITAMLADTIPCQKLATS